MSAMPQDQVALSLFDRVKELEAELAAAKQAASVGLSQEQADRLKQEVNTVACLTVKRERHAQAIRVKRLINDMTLPT